MLNNFLTVLSVILALTIMWMPTTAAQRGYRGTVHKNLSPEHTKPRRVKKNDDDGDDFDVVLTVTVASGVSGAESNAERLGVILRNPEQEYYGALVNGEDGSFAQGANATVTLRDVPFSDINSLQLYTVSDDEINLVGGTNEIVGVLGPVSLKFSALGYDGVGLWLENPIQEFVNDAGPFSSCWRSVSATPQKFAISRGNKLVCMISYHSSNKPFSCFTQYNDDSVIYKK